MLLYLDIAKPKEQQLYISKAVPQGISNGGSYLKRVVTGKDSDGSPQYRYIRTQEELKAWEAHHSEDKDEKQTDKPEKTEKLKDKLDKEHKAHVKLLHVKPDAKDKDTKKSLRLYIDV